MEKLPRHLFLISSIHFDMKEWRKNNAVQEYTQCPKNSVDGGLSIECSGQGVSEVFL
jgi:hypothetical protein